MLVRGSRHCCCKPPKQCEVEIPLNEYSRFSFDAKEKEDENFGVSFDNGTSSVELAGQGSYTVRVTDNPKNIFVRAHILELNAGAGGITIRRPDSDQSISLWWMGGTSYELRHGTTVLESITHTAASQDLKLELTTPRDATTDVLVYIDATLVHTEVGVAFVMPDVLHLGMVVEGPTPMGGEIRFGFFEVSPCLASTCEPWATPACYDIPILNEPLKVPKMWYVSIPWPSDFGFVDCETTPRVEINNQDVYFLLDDMDSKPIVYSVDGDWYEWTSCSFHPVTIGKAVLGVSPSSAPLPPGKYPTEYFGHCTLGDEFLPYVNDAGDTSLRGILKWNLFFNFRNNGTPESPDMEFRVSVGYNAFLASPPRLLYESSWMAADPDQELDSTITLNLSVNNTLYTGWNSQVFLVPNGASPEVTKQLLGCGEETCEPPVTPQVGQAYCMGVTLVDEADNPITYSVSMSVGYNETTGSWEWTGFIDPWEHPTCGTMDLATHKIHCVEPEEGASKQWVLDITTSIGTSRIPLSDDPEFGPVFDGTSNVFCTAETWDVFAGFPNILEDTADIFGCFDAGCSVEGWCIGGTASCDTGTCANNAFGNHLSATSSNPPGVPSKIGSAFTGPYPVTVPSGYRVWLWEDGGGVHLGVYNGTTLIEEATPIDIDCSHGDKTFELNDPSFACCSGFGRVVITLIPCGGPIVHV